MVRSVSPSWLRSELASGEAESRHIIAAAVFMVLLTRMATVTESHNVSGDDRAVMILIFASPFRSKFRLAGVCAAPIPITFRKATRLSAPTAEIRTSGLRTS
jgi:hypothetical protein